MSKLAYGIRNLTEVCFRYFCVRCNHETTWRLVSESARLETYECEDCGTRKNWTVR